MSKLTRLLNEFATPAAALPERHAQKLRHAPQHEYVEYCYACRREHRFYPKTSGLLVEEWQSATACGTVIPTSYGDGRRIHGRVVVGPGGGKVARAIDYWGKSLVGRARDDDDPTTMETVSEILKELYQPWIERQIRAPRAGDVLRSFVVRHQYGVDLGVGKDRQVMRITGIDRNASSITMESAEEPDYLEAHYDWYASRKWPAGVPECQTCFDHGVLEFESRIDWNAWPCVCTEHTTCDMADPETAKDEDAECECHAADDCARHDASNRYALTNREREAWQAAFTIGECPREVDRGYAFYCKCKAGRATISDDTLRLSLKVSVAELDVAKVGVPKLIKPASLEERVVNPTPTAVRIKFSEIGHAEANAITVLGGGELPRREPARPRYHEDWCEGWHPDCACPQPNA